jgi:hypothetical protein
MCEVHGGIVNHPQIHVDHNIDNVHKNIISLIYYYFEQTTHDCEHSTIIYI